MYSYTALQFGIKIWNSSGIYKSLFMVNAGVEYASLDVNNQQG
jgi:hypothetical protein